MSRLHQIIAVEKGVKGGTEKALTEAYHVIQKPELFNGLDRTYEPATETDERRPAESKKVQFSADTMIQKARAAVTELMDITATKDAANTQAKADIVVGGAVLATGVPVTTLLFLEKRLTDVRTFVSKLPTLDPAETWVRDPNTGHYVTEARETASTREDVEFVTVATATDKHAAQIQPKKKTVISGYWKQRRISGALAATDQQAFLERTDALLRAVKLAREEANSTTAEERKIGAKLLAYIFG